MKRFCILMICLSILGNKTIRAQETQETEQRTAPGKETMQTLYHRDYMFLAGDLGDVNNAVANTRTLSKLLFDAYYRAIAPGITNPLFMNSIGALWSFTVTWLSSMAPHEFGHFFRANEVNANFWIESLGFPGPVGYILFPETKTKEDELNFVTAGIEVNTLYAMSVQEDWYRHGSLYNDELFVTLFHKIIFPAYAFIIDPAYPRNWRDEHNKEIALGDVASTARLIFERQNKTVILQDGSVNPDLVTYYNWTKLVSLLVNLLDFNTYYEAAALFSGETNGQHAPWLLGNSTWGYAYGLFTTISQLGTEVYLHNYLAINGTPLLIYFRYGFPLKNYGMGMTLWDIKILSWLQANVTAHIWTQEYASFGGAVEGTLFVQLHPRWSLIMLGRWKSPGYMIGLPLHEGFSFMGGLKYNLAP